MPLFLYVEAAKSSGEKAAEKKLKAKEVNIKAGGSDRDREPYREYILDCMCEICDKE